MTLKVFNQGNFENIANLNKDNKEDKDFNARVEKSAKKNILKASGIYAGCLALGSLLAVRGNKSKALQNISELILAPGTAFEDLPEDWVCPVCGVGKDDFQPVEE